MVTYLQSLTAGQIYQSIGSTVSDDIAVAYCGLLDLGAARVVASAALLSEIDNYQNLYYPNCGNIDSPVHGGNFTVRVPTKKLFKDQFFHVMFRLCCM